MVSALAGLGKVGGGGESNAAVLGAIAELRSYIAKEFKALNARLDRIDDTLESLVTAIQHLDGKINLLQWAVASLAQDTNSLSVQVARGDLAILEEIDEQAAIEWSAYRDARLTLPPRDIARFKGIFASRAVDAFDEKRVGPRTEPDFARLNEYLQLGSIKNGPSAIGDTEENAKSLPPISLVVAAINKFELEGPTTQGQSSKRLVLERTPVNIAVVVAAVEGYCEVHQMQSRLPAKTLVDQAPSIDAMTRKHLLMLRRALDCAKGMTDLVKPGPSSALDSLLTQTDDELLVLAKALEQLEWRAMRAYLIDILDMSAVGDDPEAHHKKWPSLAPTVATKIPLEMVPGLDTFYPPPGIEPTVAELDPAYHLFTGVPGIFVRGLGGYMLPPLSIHVDIPIVGAFDDVQQIYTVNFKFAFQFYGQLILDTSLNADQEFTIPYYGYLPDTDSNWEKASHETFESRLKDPTQPYGQHPQRLWFFATRQWGPNEAPKGWGKDVNNSGWTAVRNRLTAALQPLRALIDKDINDGEIKNIAHARQKGDQLLQILTAQLNPMRSYLLQDYLTLDPAPEKAARDPARDREKVQKSLDRLSELLTTVRAVLMTGMPAAYNHLDLLHALFDGSSKTEGQLRLPHSALLEKSDWESFVKSLEVESRRAPETFPGLGLSPVNVQPKIDDPAPYQNGLTRSMKLLRHCIGKMIEISDKSDLPYRMFRANQLLSEAERNSSARLNAEH